MADFAKIVKASDGEQVLFYKAQDDEGRPQLRQITEMEGCTGELNLGFKPEEWDALDSAFDKADAAQADAVREQFRKFFQGAA